MQSLLLSLLVCGLLVVGINRLERWQSGRHAPALSSRKAAFLFRGLFAALLLIWLIAFLCFYPGTFGADAPAQFGMYQGFIPLSTHQPLLHTFMIGSLMDLTEKLLGNPVPGISLYILIYQILFTAFAIAKASQSLYWRNVPLWILIAGPLLLAVNPIVMALICYTTKDIPFAAALLLFITSLAGFLDPPKQGAPKPNVWFLLLWGVLMSLLRSQGLYMAAFGMLVLLFQYRKDWKNRKFLKIEALQAIILVLTLIVNSLFPVLFHFKKADFREALPVPIQQMAAVLRDNALAEQPFLDPALTEEALAYFDGFTPENVDPYSADSMKSLFDSKKVKQNPVGFAATWLGLVMADFRGALGAYCSLIGPYFDMRTSPHNALIVLYYQGAPERPVDIEQTPLLPGLHAAIESLLYDSSNPETCSWWFRLCDPAWTLYLIAFLIVYACIYKNRLLSLVLIYPAAYILTMMLGPVSLLRYSYVYLMEFPYLIGCLFAEPQKSSVKIKRAKEAQAASAEKMSPAFEQRQ